MVLWLCVCDYIIKVLIIKQENENLWENVGQTEVKVKLKRKKEVQFLHLKLMQFCRVNNFMHLAAEKTSQTFKLL